MLPVLDNYSDENFHDNSYYIKLFFICLIYRGSHKSFKYNINLPETRNTKNIHVE